METTVTMEETHDVGEASVKAAMQELKWLRSAKKSSSACPPNVGDAERIGSAIAGAALLALALRRRRSAAALLLGAAGGALLARGISGHSFVYDLFKMNTLRPETYRLLDKSERTPARPSKARDAVEQASQESFPASDAPGWTAATA